MIKDSFVLYTEWREYSRFLTEKDKAALYDAMYAFHAGEDMEELPPQAQIVFTLMCLQFGRDGKKWEETRRRRAEAGQRSGESRRERAHVKRTNEQAMNRLCKPVI